MKGISRNKQSQDVEIRVVLRTTPGGGQLPATGLNRLARPINWLVPWSTISHKNPIFVHAVEKILSFYRTRKFITVFLKRWH
jgi:hypothetical protein